ncbi:hypothetical protein [Lachnoclostridium sp.]|nr:hypothetical protein [Lachnoclostridium sp.]
MKGDPFLIMIRIKLAAPETNNMNNNLAAFRQQGYFTISYFL